MYPVLKTSVIAVLFFNKENYSSCCFCAINNMWLISVATDGSCAIHLLSLFSISILTLHCSTISETDISYVNLLCELYNHTNQLCHVWHASIAVSQGARHAIAQQSELKRKLMVRTYSASSFCLIIWIFGFYTISNLSSFSMKWNANPFSFSLRKKHSLFSNAKQIS
jgi:hypothetical protein